MYVCDEKLERETREAKRRKNFLATEKEKSRREREREREKNGGKKETQHAQHEEEEKEAKRRRDLDQPQSIYRACNDTSPRNRFARETERETWRGPSIRELDEESGIESARDRLLEGGTEGAKERERRGGIPGREKQPRRETGMENVEKAESTSRGELKSLAKIREEGIRTRMEIEWRRNGSEGSRIEREREKEREYVCRASARVRVFRVYRVSSDSLFLGCDFNRTISL